MKDTLFCQCPIEKAKMIVEISNKVYKNDFYIDHESEFILSSTTEDDFFVLFINVM